MNDEACDDAGTSLLSHESEPEWAQVAGMASDLVVTVGQRAFHAHQYPLYALVALLRSHEHGSSSGRGEGTGPIQANLSFLPGAALSFVPIACHGRPCRLSPHSVLLVRSAAQPCAAAAAASLAAPPPLPAALPALSGRALIVCLNRRDEGAGRRREGWGYNALIVARLSLAHASSSSSPHLLSHVGHRLPSHRLLHAFPHIASSPLLAPLAGPHPLKSNLVISCPTLPYSPSSSLH
ncbi:unnamed protein product [Closterium sp. Naga37s-1]|nr:unnamed protein product [Closterium sp. Naga37s-1]